MVQSSALNAELCVICKGTRLLCGRGECPILLKQNATLPLRRLDLSSDIEGPSPPSFFVGHHNYPRILVGPMIPVLPSENPILFDEPDLWYGRDFEELIRYRTGLIRTTFLARAQDARLENNHLMETSKELVMASKPVQTEAVLSKAPQFQIDLDSLSAPMGPQGQIKRLTITENPSILPVVDRAVGDTDFHSVDAIVELYRAGLTVTQIQKLLSAGLLGIQKQRKLVPTRWSITATDDTVSKANLEKIKDYPELGEYRIFKSHYLDNMFVAVLLPHSWVFEQLETWHPGSSWIGKESKYIIVQDHEFYNGRRTYANKTAGAYYAARLAATEYLQRVHRQAGVIIFREIRPGYIFPLGVWQIRENLRHAFQETPFTASSLEDALTIVAKAMLTPLPEWLAKSQVYKLLTQQSMLTSFITNELGPSG